MKLLLATALVLTVPAAAVAQGTSRTSLVGFAGTGNITPDSVFTYWVGPTWSAGAGVEHRFTSGVLVQGEIESLQRPRSIGPRSQLLPSVNAGFASSRAGIRPFVSGGYTLIGGSAAFNYGGGVNVPLSTRVAARFEIRDHLFMFDTPLHSFGVRFGLVF
jgi:hypothetical protein